MRPQNQIPNILQTLNSKFKTAFQPKFLTSYHICVLTILQSISGPIVAEDSKQKNQREKEERKRMQMYLTIQSEEIRDLKAEITVLKRKDFPPFPQSLSLNSLAHYPGNKRELILLLFFSLYLAPFLGSYTVCLPSSLHDSFSAYNSSLLASSFLTCFTSSILSTFFGWFITYIQIMHFGFILPFIRQNPFASHSTSHYTLHLFRLLLPPLHFLPLSYILLSLPLLYPSTLKFCTRQTSPLSSLYPPPHSHSHLPSLLCRKRTVWTEPTG